MKTLIIYDNTGYIIFQMSGSYRIPEGGIQYLETEVENNKRVISIDTSTIPHKIVLENIPKTEMQLAQERIMALEQSNAELTQLITTETKNA